MTHFYCDKEMEVLEAVRCGALRADIEKHAAGCPICADTLTASEFLLAERRAVPRLPSPDFLWWKAQIASQQKAMERATRSIALVKKLSYLGVSAAAMWLLFAPGYSNSILGVVSSRQMWPARAFSQGALVIGAVAILFTLLSSLYFARSER
jgi:hypothetical protein